MRPLWQTIPPPWEVRAEQQLVLLPKGLVRIICQPVVASVNAVLLERLNEEHRKQGRPIADLLEDAIRLLLDPHPESPDLPVLPSDRPLIDLADPKALERAAGRRR